MNILISLFAATSGQFDLPPGLLASVCYVESTYDVNAIHEDDGVGDSLGICQIKLSTAQWLGFEGTEQELMDPTTNIYYAGKYLKRNLIRYRGDIARALIAYNRGNANNLTVTHYSTKVIKQWQQGEMYASR